LVVSWMVGWRIVCMCRPVQGLIVFSTFPELPRWRYHCSVLRAAEGEVQPMIGNTQLFPPTVFTYI